VHRNGIRTATRVFVAALAAACALAGAARAASCPDAGASVRVVLTPVVGAPPATAIVFGILAAASCAGGDDLATTYNETLTCAPETPDSCRATFDGLRPGTWIHRVVLTAGEPVGQFQARRGLLLDGSAGSHRVDWPLYRSVHTVATLDDGASCTDCFRAALAAADSGLKPALVQFAADLGGAIRLQTGLPPLVGGQVTIDGFDRDGAAFSRTVDGNGLDVGALRIQSASNAVLGLRVANVGGDSDVMVLQGSDAVDNVIDSVHVVGRAVTVCGSTGQGCIIDGDCRVPTPQSPQGVCGNDGIAVRALAGAAGPNHIRRSTITGARDKGIKVSELAVAVVEDSIVLGNADGGLQATLSGHLTAHRNLVIRNRGTTSANGLAANGATSGSSVPARLETRGNLSMDNALRGISVRSLSVAGLRDDFVCGNSVGVALLDAAGLSPVVGAHGLAIVRNANSGIVVDGGSRATFGDLNERGLNAVAFNGAPRRPTPMNFRNQTDFPVAAIGNFWERCGAQIPCDVLAVQTGDIFAANRSAPVSIVPAQPSRRRAAPRITAIDPPFAAAGDMVRIFGSGFDAIEGSADSCAAVADVNTCHPLRGNCVLIDRQPAEVIAVTPTMVVVRAPFTCVEPVTVATRTRWSHGFGRAEFCVVPDAP
jgi:hypothetical protein